MHLAYRWFTGLGFDQEVAHHSTFSKNHHGRFQESPLFLELFERIVQQCMEVGLLKGAELSVDSTRIRADASPDRTITREQLPDVAKVNRTEVCAIIARHAAHGRLVRDRPSRLPGCHRRFVLEYLCGHSTVSGDCVAIYSTAASARYLGRGTATLKLNG